MRRKKVAVEKKIAEETAKREAKGREIGLRFASLSSFF